MKMEDSYHSNQLQILDFQDFSAKTKTNQTTTKNTRITNLASKSCEGSQLVKVRGFHGTRTYGFGVSAEVFYRLSYEDPYVGSRPI